MKHWKINEICSPLNYPARYLTIFRNQHKDLKWRWLDKVKHQQQFNSMLLLDTLEEKVLKNRFGSYARNYCVYEYILVKCQNDIEGIYS